MLYFLICVITYLFLELQTFPDTGQKYQNQNFPVTFGLSIPETITWIVVLKKKKKVTQFTANQETIQRAYFS